MDAIFLYIPIYLLFLQMNMKRIWQKDLVEFAQVERL